MPASRSAGDSSEPVERVTRRVTAMPAVTGTHRELLERCSSLASCHCGTVTSVLASSHAACVESLAVDPNKLGQRLGLGLARTAASFTEAAAATWTRTDRRRGWTAGEGWGARTSSPPKKGAGNSRALPARAATVSALDGPRTREVPPQRPNAPSTVGEKSPA
eukprot:2469224-Rhodomonas_salina.1